MSELISPLSVSELSTKEELSIKKDGKFLSVLVPINRIKITDVFFKRYSKYGTTYKIVFTIDFDGIQGTKFMCRTNTLYQKQYLQQYKKYPSDTIGFFADFLELNHQKIREILRQNNRLGVIKELTDLISAQAERKIKIDSTIMKSGELIKVLNVRYTDEDLRETLKTQFGFQWNPVEKLWEGSGNSAEVLELKNIYPHIIVSFQETPDKSSEILYKVFNIATERHYTIPFAKIRDIIQKMFNIPIVMDEQFDEKNPFEVLKEDVIIEYKIDGNPAWDYRIQLEDFDQNDQLLGFIRILSGDNTKAHSIQVMVMIKVHSCMNSMVCAFIVSIKHLKEWEDKLRTALSSAKTIMTESMNAVKKAINLPITLMDAEQYIKSLNFGLKSAEKVQYVQKILKDRLEYQLKQKQTQALNRWDVSQAITFVGSHPEEYVEDMEKNEISDGINEKLQRIGFEVLNPIQS